MAVVAKTVPKCNKLFTVKPSTPLSQFLWLKNSLKLHSMTFKRPKAVSANCRCFLSFSGCFLCVVGSSGSPNINRGKPNHQKNEKYHVRRTISVFCRTQDDTASKHHAAIRVSMSAKRLDGFLFCRRLLCQPSENDPYGRDNSASYSKRPFNICTISYLFYWNK